jgi:hypothetical protein
MTHERDHVIIDDYKTRISFYGWFTVPAWALVAAPLVIGVVLGKVF